MNESKWIAVCRIKCGLRKIELDTVPIETMEVVVVNEVSQLRAFAQMVMPLAKPGLSDIGPLSLLMAWSTDYPSMLNTRVAVLLRLADLRNLRQFVRPRLSEVVAIAVLPPALNALGLQPYIVSRARPITSSN